ncbi:acyl-CoA dehydrogenase family protein [Mycolicibacterium sp. XJ1819]
MSEPDAAAVIRESLAGLFATGLTGTELKARLLDDGWFDMVDEEPQSVLREMFDLQGEVLADASPALDLVALHALSAHIRANEILDGASATAILHPVHADAEHYLSPVCGTLTSDTVNARGIALAGFSDAKRLIVPVMRSGTMMLVDLDPRADVRVSQITGIDGSLGWYDVSVSGVPRILLAGDAAAAAWKATTAFVRHALSYELIALGRALLTAATQHVAQRRQFGRAIGSFQAVRHQLAEAHVAVESASLAAEAAWDTGDPLHLAVANAMAGDAHRHCGDASLQTHGAIGFTAEYGLHRFMRRGWALAALTGSTRQLDAAIGYHVSRTTHAPRIGSLAEPGS